MKQYCGVKIMENKKLSLVSCSEVFLLKLSIPIYQRPYKWSANSASLLFNDIYNSYKDKKDEYRIGSIILHKNKNDEYDIVDGQQRLTTLAILLYCFEKLGKNSCKCDLLEKKFNNLSNNAIIENYKILNKHCKDIKEELDSFISYLLEKCTFVQIVVEKQQEAFQFFDSQNSRGKPLAPHDLLKSYHLREMNDETTIKIELIERWELLNQNALASFFERNLYPLVRWYKNKSGLYYSEKRIKTFKGIKKSNNFHHAIYHKASCLFVEKANMLFDLFDDKDISKFQLTQPLIAGRNFFEYVLYYFDLYKKLLEKINLKYAFIKKSGAGNTYIKTLFVNAVIFFVDRFNEEALTDAKLDFFARWAYSLRLVMQRIYMQTVNNYALKGHDRINSGLKLFERMSEMQSPDEMDDIILDDVLEKDLKEYKTEKYKDTWKEIF